MTNEQVVRDACRVVWTEGDMDRVGEFYSEDFQANYPRTDWGTGVQGVRELAAGIRASFPDYREQIDELIVADDLVIVRLTIRGTHNGPLPNLAPTGKAVEFNDVTICRVRGDKIVEQRGLSDHFALYQQLGLIDLSD
jgi:predicted ester cyclase